MATKTLLLINPNTSQAVTDKMLGRFESLRSEAKVHVQARTARLGAPYIACETSYAIAGHAVLDSWAEQAHSGGSPDAILIGCFGDPGLYALRERAPCPVIGLAQAAFEVAKRQVQTQAATSAAPLQAKFSVVTGGAAWRPMLFRLAQNLGYADHLADIVTVQASGAQLAADPQAALGILGDAIAQAARDPRVGCVIVGGAGLAGYAAKLQPNTQVKLIDSVEAGWQMSLEAMRLQSSEGQQTWSDKGHQGPATRLQTSGLSASLAAALNPN